DRLDRDRGGQATATARTGDLARVAVGAEREGGLDHLDRPDVAAIALRSADAGLIRGDIDQAGAAVELGAARLRQVSERWPAVVAERREIGVGVVEVPGAAQGAGRIVTEVVAQGGDTVRAGAVVAGDAVGDERVLEGDAALVVDPAADWSRVAVDRAVDDLRWGCVVE